MSLGRCRTWRSPPACRRRRRCGTPATRRWRARWSRCRARTRRTRTRRPARSRRWCRPLQHRRRVARRSAGPMSRIRSSSATSAARFTVGGRVGGERPCRDDVGRDRHRGAARRIIASIIACASPTRSGSARLLPIGSPAASRKVLAMPPPTISRSTLSARLCRIVSLVETLRPATIATSGRFGLGERAADRVDLGREQRAGAGDASRTSAMPWVVASARCAVPNASLTKTSHSAAIFRASAGSFFFSPLLKRQFSSSTSCAGVDVDAVDPVAHQRHVAAEQLAEALGDGRERIGGLNSPSVGRPRCEVTITAAPAAERHAAMPAPRRGCGCRR